MTEHLLTELSGAEAAMVVNNNAGATMLTLAALAGGREVIVSRGQLVEIGGSYRLPKVMTAAGAVLCEVGTTTQGMTATSTETGETASFSLTGALGDVDGDGIDDFAVGAPASKLPRTPPTPWCWPSTRP